MIVEIDVGSFVVVIDCDGEGYVIECIVVDGMCVGGWLDCDVFELL